MSDIPLSTVSPDIMPPTHAHGIGDSCTEKLLSPSQSVTNLSDVSRVSSFASCESFKTICKAWKNRLASVSNMKLKVSDLEEKLEDLTSQLDMSQNVTCEESKELAKRLSLCVVLESRTLHLTDSSEEDKPNTAKNSPKRFLEPEEIREAFATFKHFDGNADNYIDLLELKMALEKLSVPQTHLAAKRIMADIAGCHATKMSFCQFLLTYAAIVQNSNPKDTRLSIVTPKEYITVSNAGVSGVPRLLEENVAQPLPAPRPELLRTEESDLSTTADLRKTQSEPFPIE